MGLQYQIFELAKQQGYTKTALRKAAGLSTVTLAKLGKNEPVGLEIILRLCDVLQCQPGDLVFYESESEGPLLSRLKEELRMNLKGGLYHRTQVLLTYNSNHIEGSCLTEDQTRYIYETNTIGAQKELKAVNVDDVIETVNHFEAFRHVIRHARDPLTEGLIKELHRILKSGTSDGRKEWFAVGDYKTRVNVVGDQRTTPPGRVAEEMAALLRSYDTTARHKEEQLIDFHYRFETIHPFQDGNGRVGRLLLFKECLKNDLVPIIILDSFKEYYYRGLKEYEKERGYLIDTCLHGQDYYRELMKEFELPV